MFKIEILDGEQVYAWNVCDEGFNRDDKKEEFFCRIAEGNHNSNKQGYQQRRRNQAKWQKQWCKFGDAWLANHNDEGHIIG